jgi:hypothetical protein
VPVLALNGSRDLPILAGLNLPAISAALGEGNSAGALHIANGMPVPVPQLPVSVTVANGRQAGLQSPANRRRNTE